MKGGSIRRPHFIKYTPHVKYDHNEYRDELCVQLGCAGDKGRPLSDGANVGSQASNA